MRKIISFILAMMLALPNAVYATGIPVSRHWPNAMWNAGGTYPMVVPDVEIAGRLYLISDVAGCWFSNDYGEHWEWMNNKLDSIFNLAFIQSKKNPAYLYMIGKTYIVRSKDRGRNWETMKKITVNGTRGFKPLAIDPNNEKTVYIALANGKVQRAVNDGQFADFVTPFGANIAPTFLHINKAGTYLYVGSQTLGLKRYTLADGTETVISLSGTNSNRVWDFSTYEDLSGVEHLCVSAGLSIGCSDDDGVSFDYTQPITADTQFFISFFATRQLANGEVRFMAHGRRISTQYGTNIDVHSNDTGATWVSHYNDVTFDTSIRGEFVNFGVMGNVFNYASDPSNEDIFYSTTDQTVFKTVDAAATWDEKSVGAMNVVLSDVKVDPLGGWWVAGMDIGLTYSSTKGVNWESMVPHPPVDDPQGFGISGHYWRVEFPGFGGNTKAEWEQLRREAWEAGHGVIIVTASMYINSPVYVPTVWRSEDSGATWENSSSGLPTTQLNGVAAPHRALWGIGYPRGLACHPNGSACYLGVDGYSATEMGGVFISRDRGKTWSRTGSTKNWMIYNAVAVDPTDPTGNTAIFAESFISGDNPHFWKTTNGYDWADAGIANYGIYDVTYNSLGNAFATGLYTGPEFYYSTNGGAGTWNPMHQLNNTSNIADAIYCDPDDPDVCLAGVNDGTSVGPGTGTKIGGSIYMTVDATNFEGATWVEITGDLPNVSGVAAITIDKDCGEAGCILAATEAGLFSMELNDRISTYLEGIETCTPETCP